MDRDPVRSSVGFGTARFLQVAKFALCVCLVWVCAIAPSSWGQAGAGRTLKNEFGIWGGYSPGSPHLFAASSDHQLSLLAFRYARVLHSWQNLSLEYTVDVFPLALIGQPTIKAVFDPGPPPLILYKDNGREAVYGGGINPIGLKLNFFHRRRFEPFVASSIGFVASVRPVPLDIPGEDQFNFTFDFQLGLERFNSSRNRAWMFGYRLQHISNAHRSVINPGMDANVIFAGYSFFK